jgi:hypothetical protein
MTEWSWLLKELQASILSLGKNLWPEPPVLPESIVDAYRRYSVLSLLQSLYIVGQPGMDLSEKSTLHNIDHGGAGGITVTDLNAKLAEVGGKP